MVKERLVMASSMVYGDCDGPGSGLRAPVSAIEAMASHIHDEYLSDKPVVRKTRPRALGIGLLLFW